MRVIKPQRLSLLTRCFEYRQRFLCGISTLMSVPLGDGQELGLEAAMWQLAVEQLGETPLESGIPKVAPEYLLAGNAYPPQRPAEHCPVRVRLGDREKILVVHGDRYWRDYEEPSESKPFERMPLVWANAWGGKDVAVNPQGKGARPIAVPGGEVQPLPNLESPDSCLTASDKCIEPVCYLPLDQTWPQRAALVGNYDDNWLKTRFPGFPDDIDWRFFNLAPDDQRFGEPLSLSAAYELENLHPTQQLITGRLPGLRSRCYLRRKGRTELEGVPQELRTVWFFPEAHRAVLIFQGVAVVADEEATDIEMILCAAERASQPRADAHYAEVVTKRLDPEEGLLHALRESDLLPEGFDVPDPMLEAQRKLTEGQDLLRLNARKRALREIEKARAVAVSYGLDPDLHAPTLPPADPVTPTLEQLPAFFKKIVETAEKQRKIEELDMLRRQQDTARQLQALGHDFASIQQERQQAFGGPPDFNAAAQINALATLRQSMANLSMPTAELDLYLDDPTFRQRLHDGERKLKEAYRFNAHLQNPAPPMPTERLAEVREFVRDAVDAGRSLSNHDLTGADLSGLDLSEADLSGAFLEGANLSDARLTGANLDKAVLTRSRLNNADLSGAQLRGANLGLADCGNARLTGIDASEAIFRGARLSGALLNQARLDHCDFTEAEFAATDFSGADLSDNFFIEMTLTGARFTNAILDRSAFLKCSLDGVDFSGCHAHETVFLGIKASAAKFQGANLNEARFVEHCLMDDADFTDATLSRCNLREARLPRALFIRSALDNADLSGCNLQHAYFYQAQAPGARFVRADLTNAVLFSASLPEASFQRAQLRNADFRAANLYAADFARAEVDRSTLFANALLLRARTYPRLQMPAAEV